MCAWGGKTIKTNYVYRDRGTLWRTRGKSLYLEEKCLSAKLPNGVGAGPQSAVLSEGFLRKATQTNGSSNDVMEVRKHLLGSGRVHEDLGNVVLESQHVRFVLNRLLLLVIVLHRITLLLPLFAAIAGPPLDLVLYLLENALLHVSHERPDGLPA